MSELLAWIAAKMNLNAEEIADVHIEAEPGREWSEWTSESFATAVSFTYRDEQRWY